jgi:hypothetical protein
VVGKKGEERPTGQPRSALAGTVAGQPSAALVDSQLNRHSRSDIDLTNPPHKEKKLHIHNYQETHSINLLPSSSSGRAHQHLKLSTIYQGCGLFKYILGLFRVNIC